MSETKKKDFGLAAQLARGTQRAVIPEQSEEESKPAEQLSNLGNIERLKHSETFQQMDASPIASPIKNTSKRHPGRPRRLEETTRMTLVLSREASEYLDSSWRTHRRFLDGKYVNGPSAFIEELLRAHRRSSA